MVKFKPIIWSIVALYAIEALVLGFCYYSCVTDDIFLYPTESWSAGEIGEWYGLCLLCYTAVNLFVAIGIALVQFKKVLLKLISATTFIVALIGLHLVFSLAVLTTSAAWHSETSETTNYGIVDSSATKLKIADGDLADFMAGGEEHVGTYRYAYYSNVLDYEKWDISYSLALDEDSYASFLEKYSASIYAAKAECDSVLFGDEEVAVSGKLEFADPTDPFFDYYERYEVYIAYSDEERCVYVSICVNT